PTRQGPEGLDKPGGDHRGPALSGGGRGQPQPGRGSLGEARTQTMSVEPAELRLEDDPDAADVAKAYAELSPETSRSRELVWQDPVPTAAAGATMTGMEYMRAVVEAK